MYKLALTLPVSKLETPTSYLSRLAARNHCDSISSFCYDVGIELGAVSSGDREAIQFITKIADLPRDSFAQTTILKTTTMRYQLGKEGLDTRTLNRGEVRICPSCILQDISVSGQIWDAIHQLHWQIPQIERCVQHGVKLITLVEKNNTAARFDFIRAIRAHRAEIEASKNEGFADPFDVYLSRRIYGEMPDGWGQNLDIPALWRSSEALGTLLIHGKKRDGNRLNGHERRIALLRGFLVLQSGRDGIRAELSSFTKNTPREKGYQPSPQYGGLQRLLGSSNKQREGYNPLRDIVREYIADNYPLKAGYVAFGIPITERKVHSVRSASLEVKIRRVLVEEMLIERDYGIRRKEGQFELTKILTAEVVEDLKCERDRFLSKNEAADYLGSTEGMFKELHKSGFLQPKLGKGRWERKAFDKLHLDSFLKTVFDEVPILDKIPEGAVLLDLSTRSANCSVSDILRLVVNGNLRPVGRLGKERHLKHLLINTNELLMAFPPRVSNGYTKTEACKILHMDTRSLNHLISVELLKTRRMKSSITRVTNDLILPQSIEAFQNTYCSLGMLRQSDPALSDIRLRDLDAMDIVPFVDIKGLRRIYKLEDLPKDLALELNSLRENEELTRLKGSK